MSTFTAQPATLPRAYADAAARLTGRCAQRRKIANNTWLERRGEDIAIRLHQTDIVTLHPNGHATLDTGGWLTVTTKSRMNDALPGGVRIASDRGRWYVHAPGEDRVPYADGMVIDMTYRRVVSGAPTPEAVKAADSANVATRKAINDYLRTTTAAEIVHAFENPGGDCWLCAGMAPTDPEHLRQHLDEHYVMLEGDLLPRRDPVVDLSRRQARAGRPALHRLAAQVPAQAPHHFGRRHQVGAHFRHLTALQGESTSAPSPADGDSVGMPRCGCPAAHTGRDPNAGGTQPLLRRHPTSGRRPTMKLYLRKAGKRTPIKATGEIRTKVWGVRIDGVLVGYVTAAKHPITKRENVPGFRGFTAAGTPVTGYDGDRTRVRNLAAARRDWT